MLMLIIILSANIPIKIKREYKNKPTTLPVYIEDINITYSPDCITSVKDHSRCVVKGHCRYVNGAWSFVLCPGSGGKNFNRLCYED
jgi:hypothetical protein